MNNKQVSIMINADVYAVLKKQAALDERSVRSWFERYIKATFEDDYNLITGIAVKKAVLETISHAPSDVDDILKKFTRHEQVTEQVTEQVDTSWLHPTPPDPRIVAEIDAAEQAQYDEDADYFGLTKKEEEEKLEQAKIKWTRS